MRNNKRIFSLVMIVLLCVVCLTGCSGSNTEEIKEELRGKWSYDFYASYVGQHCHQVYEFKGDGTFESAWIVDEAPKRTHTIVEHTRLMGKGSSLLLTMVPLQT